MRRSECRIFVLRRGFNLTFVDLKLERAGFAPPPKKMPSDLGAVQTVEVVPVEMKLFPLASGDNVLMAGMNPRLWLKTITSAGFPSPCAKNEMPDFPERLAGLIERGPARTGLPPSAGRDRLRSSP